MTDLNSAAPPRAVVWLGYGGLLPFVVFALVSALDQHAARWTFILLAYGAVILSFVGALHWAVAMLTPEDAGRHAPGWTIWSVVPALLGWAALMLAQAGQARIAAAVLMAGFVLHYLRDTRLVRQRPMPGWYLPLRLRLSFVAVVCLGATFLR